MNVSLAYHNGGVPCDAHNREGINSRLAKPGQHRMSEGVLLMPRENFHDPSFYRFLESPYRTNQDLT